MDSSPSRFPRSAPADTNDPRNVQQRNMPIASPLDRPSTAAKPFSHVQDVPIVAQPVPPVQRGRVSPFPTAPVLPREQTKPLMRQTSKVTREAVNRVLNQNMPASASPYANGHGRWPSNEVRVVEAGPASAQPYFASAGDGRWPSRPTEQLGVRWAPRSASAMDTRRPLEGDGSSSDDGRSWLVYDDEDDAGGVSDQSLSVPNTRPASTEPPEPSPDVNAILAGFRAQRDAAREGRDRAGKSDAASKHDTLAGIVAGYERETVYLDVDEGGGDRSSVWSDANSRHSFLDNERSAEIRAKFVKRVEAMYGKDVVPPVPPLEQSLSSRGG